ncbi:MAG: ribonuclease R winged-helix domain protein [uncultured archaeon A07HN63]|nr:MAG: ribonuclease R winged-helix domain protein [uncultured archaeon A07HN63]
MSSERDGSGQQGRDEAGRFDETVTDQEILKVFDYEDDPVLTASEVATGLQRFGVQMTSEGVRNRLDSMADDDFVSRKQLGARAVGWWAEVAPELAAETAAEVDRRADAEEWDEL